MSGYYVHGLAGHRLLRCYELASPRIRRYLEAEIQFVAEQVHGARRVLELGCGYGRVMKRLSPSVAKIAGCDTSRESLAFARSYLAPHGNCALVLADALQMGFTTGAFDATVCIQNGVSAFGEDPRQLVVEAVRVTRIGGLVLFSTYSPRIWSERLDWFREQAREGLIGPIDETQTRDGTIVCTDGFRATTLAEAELLRLFDGVTSHAETREVDGSSLFGVGVK